MPYPSQLHAEPLSLWQSTADLYLHRRHSNTVLSQSLWGPWVLVHMKFVLALWESLVGMGFDSKCEFAPPTVFLGLLLCPWAWGISSQLLLCLLSYWGFSDLGHGLSPLSYSLQHHASPIKYYDFTYLTLIPSTNSLTKTSIMSFDSYLSQIFEHQLKLTHQINNH